jgi:hypothetical protein
MGGLGVRLPNSIATMRQRPIYVLVRRPPDVDAAPPAIASRSPQKHS